MRLRTRSDPQLDPRPRALRHSVYATAMLLAPIFLLLGTLLNPVVGGIAAGAANIAANATADPTRTSCTSPSTGSKRSCCP